MEDLLTHYSGKLYEREQVEQWDLPKPVQDELRLNEHDFFFLTSSREKEHGAQIHVHISLYPAKHGRVYLLEVELPEIKPNILHETLTALRSNEYDIITSTGFCKHEDLCHYGVFFSVPNKIEDEELQDEIRRIEGVKKVRIFEYTCQGCSELWASFSSCLPKCLFELFDSFLKRGFYFFLEIRKYIYFTLPVF